MGDPMIILRNLDKTQEEFIAMLEAQMSGMRDLADQLRQENFDLLQESEALMGENTSLRESGGDALLDPGNNEMPQPNAYERRGQTVEERALDIEVRYKKEKVIKTHTQPVHSVCRASAVAPNRTKGCYIATASWDTTVQVYDLDAGDAGALVTTLGSPADVGGAAPMGNECMGGLYCVAFARTPDHAHILGCASADNNSYLWDHTTGDWLGTLRGHDSEVNGINFHPTQQVCCTVSDDLLAIVWDFPNCQEIRKLDGHTREVYTATFLDSGYEHYVVTACFDRKVRMYDMRGPSIVQELQGHSDDILGVDFCANTQQLGSSADDGTICIWDVRTFGEPLFTIDSRASPGIVGNELKRLCFNQDGTKVACGCSAWCTLVYDLSGGYPELNAYLEGHSDCVFDVCWGIDDNGNEFLVDASHDCTSYIWRPV